MIWTKFGDVIAFPWRFLEGGVFGETPPQTKEIVAVGLQPNLGSREAMVHV